MPEADVKRASFRFYMNRKEDKEIWDMLRNLEAVGYHSMQAFANDAFSHYYTWLYERRVPFMRSEIETEFKQWMGEVLESVCISRGALSGTGGLPTIPKEESAKEPAKEPETLEIKEDTFNLANDFLSTL